MTFTYTYRDASGATKSEVIEASARSEVFGVLKQRGIVPLSVREGGRLSGSADRGGTRGSKNIKIALVAIAAAVVLLSLIIGTMSLGKDSSGKSKKTKGDSFQRVAKGEKASPVKDAAAKTSVGKSAVATVAKKTAVPSNEIAVIDSNAPTLPDPTGNVPPPAVSLPPSTFDTASDQVIAMALQADEHGMAPMPLSKDLEKEFLESLKREIVILDTDDEQTKALKEEVMATRTEIKKLLDQGQSFNQIMQEHQKLANENAKIRDDATVELKKILDSGDVEGAKAYKRKINIALGQMGIKGLSIPVTEEEREERAASRRERMLERRARQAAAAEAAEALRNAQSGK